ncbi:MAG: hypothetical protein KUG67_03235, partial [Proteobacteria bacterium]|nr:hypothetical protein [Pseudomonadota bacterium]
MSLIQDLIDRVTALTNRLNQIGENSKINTEHPHMDPIDREAKIRGEVDNVSQYFSLQEFIDDISNEFVLGNVPAIFRSVVIDFDAAGSTHGKVLNEINTMTNYILQQGTMFYFYTRRVVLSNDGGIIVDPLVEIPTQYAVISEYFVLTQKIEPDSEGNASIGVDGTPVLNNGIRYFMTIDNRNLEPQEFDLGEIGATLIEDAVDGSGPYSTPN